MAEERLKSPAGVQGPEVLVRAIRLRRVVQERVVEGGWSFKYRIRVRRYLYTFLGGGSLAKGSESFFYGVNSCGYSESILATAASVSS